MSISSITGATAADPACHLVIQRNDGAAALIVSAALSFSPQQTAAGFYKSHETTKQLMNSARKDLHLAVQQRRNPFLHVGLL